MLREICHQRVATVHLNLMRSEEYFHADLCTACADVYRAVEDNPLPFRPSLDENLEDLSDDRLLSKLDPLKPDPIRWDELKVAVTNARVARGE